jgi:hypothetical protein
MTNAQALEWFLRHLVRHAKTVGDELAIGEAVRDAAAAARGERADGAQRWTLCRASGGRWSVTLADTPTP